MINHIKQTYAEGFIAEYDTHHVVRVITTEIDEEQVMDSPHVLITDGPDVQNHVNLLKDKYMEIKDFGSGYTSITIWVSDKKFDEGFPPKNFTEYWRRSGRFNVSHDYGSWRTSAKTSVKIGSTSVTEFLERHIGKYVVIQLQRREK